MLKIGDFSRLGSVTVKTLRHYAALGLLKPAWIDRFTGYRYYTLQQLPRLNRILAFKDLGFTLEQIAALMSEDVPVEQMRGMLRRKQNELERRLRLEQSRLELVAARLAQIERGDCPAESSSVLVKHIGLLPVACLREVVPGVERLGECRAALAAELLGWLAERGAAAEGPWMVLQNPGEYRERDIPLEVAVPVRPELVHRQAAPAGERVRLRTLMSSGEAACLVHAGPSETLGQAYAALYAWMEANRRVPAAPAREIYLSDQAGLPVDPFGETRPVQPVPQAIEIQIPIESILSETERKVKESESNMNPKIVSRPAFTVMGLRYQGNNQNQEIPALWGEFNQRDAELQAAAVPNSCAYGVCVMAEGLPEGHFEYIAAYEVPAGTQPLPGTVVHDLPASRYAVFEHRGSLERLRETYQNIYQVWLPQSGFQVIPGVDMEVYTEEFKGGAPDSVFYIYVPVK